MQTSKLRLPASLGGRRFSSALGASAGLIALVIVFSGLNSRLLSEQSLTNIALQSSIILILGLGVTFVVLSGSIDISTEGVMALSGVVLSLLAANALNSSDLGLLALPVAVIVGSFVGFVNGVVHTSLKIPSLILTLGTWFISLGIAVALYRGFPVQIVDRTVLELPTASLNIGLLKVPLLAIIAIAALLICLAIERLTPFGTYVYAIGGDENLASLSGIPVRRIKILAFTLSGFFFGLGGALNAARLGIGTAEVGSFLFPTLTAVIVGGTALTGGAGSVLNTLVGALIVAVIANGLILSGVPPYLQSGVQGLLILGAVALTIRRRKVPFAK